MVRFQLISLLCIFSLIFLSGCGDNRGKRYPVGGKVTIDGNLIDFGGESVIANISFYPIDNGNPRKGLSSIDAECRFQVTSYERHDGLLIGNYEVAISAIKEVNSSTQKWFLPQKYADPKTSQLTWEVTKETPNEDVVFDLTWEGSKHSKPYLVKE